jgi:hypothetical protein
MRTKNILSIAALIICGLVCVNSVKADVPPTQTSDEVTVNIKFKPIQSIVVNSVQRTVNLEYYTLQNYQEGVSVTMDDHLEIFSTGGFIVTVKASGDFTRTTGDGDDIIPAGDVFVSATLAEDTSIGTPADATGLTIGGKTLITADAGGTALKYNVTYDNTAAGAGNNYINNYIHPDLPESVYTAKVTYTIATN